MMIFIIVEKFFPLKKQTHIQRENLENISWYILNQMFLFFGLNLLTQELTHRVSIFFNRYTFDISQSNVVFQFIVIATFTDLASYLGHRFLHRSDFLWNFHKLHHSSENLNALSSLRHHWLEIIYHSIFIAVFTSWFVVDLKLRIFLSFVMTFSCYFQHANINLHFPKWVDYIFITPINHRWHHSKNMATYKGMNFGFLFSFWDRVFGTYYLEKEEPVLIGTDSSYPKNLFRRIIYPLKL